MKTIIFAAIALLLRFQSFADADIEPPPIIAELGEYRLDAERKLLLSTDAQRTVKFSLMMARKDQWWGIKQSLPAAGVEPFLFHWDQAASRLWWGTATKIGFLDVSNRAFVRCEDFDWKVPGKLPEIPDFFLNAVLATFP